MGFIVMFFMLIILSPVILALLYTIFFPRESALFGKRWQFKNENLEPSDEVIKYNRTMGIIGLVVVIVVLFASMLKACK